MIRLVYHDRFLNSAKRLPLKTQQKLSHLLALFSKNPFHPLIHTKRLNGELIGFLSFRITRDWRVIFRFLNSDTVQLVSTANRKDIYR